jgi:hypothetical protein
MKRRKPVLIVDDGSDSLNAVNLLSEKGIEFVAYDIKKFAESCCAQQKRHLCLHLKEYSKD